MNENTSPDVQIIENASLDDVRPGDHITWDRTETFQGVTRTVRREGVAHHRDQLDDWRTVDDGLITDGEGDDITLTIRRTVQELPTEDGAVIVHLEHEAILNAALPHLTADDLRNTPAGKQLMAEAWDERHATRPNYSQGHDDNCMGWEDCHCGRYLNPYLEGDE